MSHFDQNRTPYRQRIRWAPSQSHGSRVLGNKLFEHLVNPDQCESRKARRLAAYWQQLINNGRLPMRHDIDPGRIRDLLANVMILELHGDPRDQPMRLRYRLVGTAISAAMGQDATGKWLEDVIADADKAARFLGLFEQLREQREPLFGQTHNSGDRRGCHNFHWAIFPLRDEQDQISHALMLEDYDTFVATRPAPITTSLSAHM